MSSPLRVCVRLLFLLLLVAARGDAQSGTEPADSPGEPAAPDQAAARIVELHLQSRGGAEKLQTLSQIHASGNLREAKVDHRVSWWWRAPTDFREERVREHLGRTFHEVRAVHGGRGWHQSLAPEAGRAREQDAAAVAALQSEAFLMLLPFRHLLDWRQHGHLLTYDGTARYGAHRVYVVKIKLTNGPLLYYYFDRRSFVLRAIGMKDDFAGTSVDADLVPTGLREVDGVLLETGWDWRVDGSTYRSIRFSKLEVVDDLPGDLFQMPASTGEIWLRQRPWGDDRE